MGFVLALAGCAEQPPQAPVPLTLAYQLPVITPAEGTAFLQKQGGVVAEVKPITYAPRVLYKVSLQLDPHLGQDILASAAGPNVTTYDVTFTPFITVEPNGPVVNLTIANDYVASDIDMSSVSTQFVGFFNGHKEDNLRSPDILGIISPHESKSDIAAYVEDDSTPGDMRLLVYGVQVIPETSGAPTRSYNFEWRMRFAMQPRQLTASTITKQIQLTDGQAADLKGAVVKSTDIGNASATRQ